MRINISIIFLTFIILFFSCEKENPTAPEETVENEKISFKVDGEAKTFSMYCGSTYEAVEKKTHVFGRKQEVPVTPKMEVYFPGSTTGTFGSSDGAKIYWTDADGTGFSGTASVTVTKYGEVGKFVEGTFSGTVTPILSTFGGGTHTIADGAFSVKRQANQ